MSNTYERKSIVNTLKIFLFLILLFSFSASFTHAEEVECPFGFINDTAPGQCARYVDTDSNELCDLSEPHDCGADADVNNPLGIQITGTELKAMSVNDVAKVYAIDVKTLATELGKSININVKTTDSLQTLHDNNGLTMALVKEVAANIYSQKGIATSEISTNTTSTSKRKSPYNFLLLTIIVIILYTLTFVLAKNHVMTLFVHRKIWNWVLLISFLTMAFFSIVLVFNREYPPGLSLPINTLFWHVETGIVMVIVSVFHAWWHIRYYLKK